jgi:hypothetical protein
LGGSRLRSRSHASAKQIFHSRKQERQTNGKSVHRIEHQHNATEVRIIMPKTLLIAVASLMLLASDANASWVLIPGDTTDRNVHGCGSSWGVCAQRRGQPRAAAAAPRAAAVNGNVPKFCYSTKTGKFTHWGPCRVVCLPTGQCVKVAH